MKQPSRAEYPSSPPYDPVVSLRELLERPVVDCHGHSIGKLVDVVSTYPDGKESILDQLVVGSGGERLAVPVGDVEKLERAEVALTVGRGDLRPFTRGVHELLLAKDVLGHRLLDVRMARLVRVRDIELMPAEGRWVVAGVDVEWGGWWHHLIRHKAYRDWETMEPLTGTEDLWVGRLSRGIGRLKVAQIADLLEQASAEEKAEVLADLRHRHALEADVVGELDEGTAAELLSGRSDADIAALLSRLSADAAADTVAVLPHDRLIRVITLLPNHFRTQVSMLLGYHPTSAGGLMSVDFLTTTADTTATLALHAVAAAHDSEPQALNTVYLLDSTGQLSGSVSLVRLVQAAPGTSVGALADTEPVRVTPETDAMDVALVMCDHNLLALPVVDSGNRLVGVITVDDVLETTIPPYWRRRTDNAAGSWTTGSAPA